ALDRSEGLLDGIGSSDGVVCRNLRSNLAVAWASLPACEPFGASARSRRDQDAAAEIPKRTTITNPSINNFFTTAFLPSGFFRPPGGAGVGAGRRSVGVSTGLTIVFGGTGGPAPISGGGAPTGELPGAVATAGWRGGVSST